MNCTPLRAIRSRKRAADIQAPAGLATLDTVPHTLVIRRATTGLSRTMLSLFACGVLSAASLPGRTQATPAPAAPAGQATPAAPAAPAAPAGPAPGSVSITGLVDVYYGINVRAPQATTGYVTPSGEHIQWDNIGRSFDINDRDPSFSLGEVNITRTPNKSFPLGITATLTVGDTARIVHANEPGGTSSWQTLQQLYLTYTPHVLGRDVAIDFGKFVTPFGYEVIESSSNDNYSRSFGFQYGVPFYHAGFRVSAPINSKISFVGGLVNGWNNVADDNNAKSFFTQFTWKPDAKFQGILGYMGGSEGTGAYGVGIAPKNVGNITTNLFEIQPMYQFNAKLKIAADIIYGGAAGDVSGIHLSGYWLGYAGYLRYQFTNHFALAGRLEQFEDTPGTGGVDLRTGGAGYNKLRSATLTFEYVSFRGHLVSRFEYRHDHSNQSYFLAGSTPVADQDTYTLGEVWKF